MAPEARPRLFWTEEEASVSYATTREEHTRSDGRADKAGGASRRHSVKGIAATGSVHGEQVST